jgi:hypothetical protein
MCCPSKWQTCMTSNHEEGRHRDNNEAETFERSSLWFVESPNFEY